MEQPEKQNICLNFDGVMTEYKGWKGEDHLDEPQEGLKDFLIELGKRGFRVIVHSTRPVASVWGWLARHELSDHIVAVSATLPPAAAYISDRAICFKGSYNDILQQLPFQAYWEKRLHV